MALALALLTIVVPTAQRWGVVWLLLVSTVGPWFIWGFAKQLYNAAMHGYVTTELAGKVHRDEQRELFRNNVIIHIVLLPIIVAGFFVILIVALEAQHLIQ